MIERDFSKATVAGTAALWLCTLAVPVLAQGLESPEAIDKIVGSEVTEQKSAASADPAKVIAAIDKASQSAETVRKTASLEKVEIVLIEGTADGGPPPAVAPKLAERKADIDSLRKEIEGNAMLFHAIDSHSILMGDVLAVDFDEPQKVVIYAATRPVSP